MDLYYEKELKVGVLVIVAVTVFTVGLLWLSGRTIGPQSTVVVPVRFTNVAGLTPGDPVRVSGVKVGQVANVVLEDVGNVMVYLEVRRANRPHTDAQAMVASADFFGEKYVDYVPGNAPEMLRDAQVITGTREVAVTEAAANLTTRAADAITGVQSLLSQRTADDIHNALVSLDRTLKVVTQIGEGPTVTEARATMSALQRLAVRLDSTVARRDLGKTLDQMDEMAQSLKKMADELKSSTTALGSILQKMDSGQGSLGRVVNDSTLHHELIETMRSLKLFLDNCRERPGSCVRVTVFE